MNVKEIDKKYKEICSSVVEKRLKNSLDILKGLVGETHLGEFTDKLAQMETTYENLLKYTIEGIEDPEWCCYRLHKGLNLQKGPVAEAAIPTVRRDSLP